MAAQNTNLSINYDLLVQGFQALGNGDPRYTQVLDFLGVLKSKTDLLITRDEKGKYPQFTNEQKAALMSIYEQLAALSENLLENHPNDPTIKSLSEFLSKDISMISQAVPGPNVTLPRIIDAANLEDVDISDIELGREGANLSSRVPMTIIDENGNEVKGFFTPEAKFDAWKLFKESIQDIKKEIPDAEYEKSIFDDFITRFEDNILQQLQIDELQNASYEGRDVREITLEGKDLYAKMVDRLESAVHDNIYENLTSVMQSLGMQNIPQYDENSDSPYFQLFNKIAGSLHKLLTYHGIYSEELGLNMNQNIDKRNAAMSTVAGLLGVPNLIVRSSPMTVIKNGVKVNGTFLPNAEGLDLAHIHPDDEIPTEDDAYNYSDGFKDLADINILDYICGNVDRHPGNMLYKYENGKFAGIQGIDNDASFGINVININEGFNRIPPKKAFGFISKSMANKVRELTPEMLKAALRGHDLTSAEIEAAVSRLQDMQDYIRECETHYANAPRPLADDKEGYTNSLSMYYARIIPDEDFKNINFNSYELKDILEPDERGAEDSKLFCADVAKREIKYMLEPNNRDAVLAEYKELKQPFIQQHKITDAIGMGRQKDIYYDKLRALVSHDKWYIKSSPQFANMKVALQDLSNLTNKYKDKPLDQRGYDRMADAFKRLEKYNNDYIKMKTAQTDRSAYANERLQFAGELRTFIQDKKEELEVRMKKEVEVRTERLLDSKAIIKGIKAKLKSNAMTPELAGETIKTANQASKLAPIKSKEVLECKILVINAMKYLSDNNCMGQSGLKKADMEEAKMTVSKGIQSEGKTREDAIQNPEIQNINMTIGNM